MKQILPLMLCAFLLPAGCRTRYPVTKDTFTAVARPASPSRGRNLALNICGGCHYDKATGRFTGKRLADLPKIAGPVYAANITQSVRYGAAAAYSDAALYYLIKTGIARDGRFLPYMMRPTIADEDLNDIIVYLRSGDAAVRPTDTAAGKTHLTLFGKLGMHLVTHPQPYLTGLQRPDESHAVAYGRYLVAMTGCYHCHSRKATSVNYLHPEQTKGYLAGGARMKTPEGKVSAPNLTFDVETGIGRYTEAQFRKAVRQGITPEGARPWAPSR